MLVILVVLSWIFLPTLWFIWTFFHRMDGQWPCLQEWWGTACIYVELCTYVDVLIYWRVLQQKLLVSFSFDVTCLLTTVSVLDFSLFFLLNFRFGWNHHDCISETISSAITLSASDKYYISWVARKRVQDYTGSAPCEGFSVGWNVLDILRVSYQGRKWWNPQCTE